ncbi:MAG: hypothetical protein QXK89_10810 [Candidatus Bathyarchaeia archaeon]
MRLINKTDVPLSLGDLLDREDWGIEYDSSIVIYVKVNVNALKDWTIRVYWLNKNAKKPFRGQFNPSKKLITVGINREIEYPFSVEVSIKTEQTSFGYKYITEKTTFNSPKELIKFIFLHEFSHLIDYFKGLNLNFKQTKANRFALRHLK